MNIQSIEKLNQLLSDFLSPQITEIISAYGTGGLADQYFVSIPEIDIVDMTMADLASLVARTSNVYGRVTRFAGMARAHQKLCEGRYKKVYKSNNQTKTTLDAIYYGEQLDLTMPEILSKFSKTYEKNKESNNPIFEVLCHDIFPLEETLVPIFKRKILSYINQQGKVKKLLS